MKMFTHWKNLLFILTIFLIGVVTGGINTVGIGKRLEQQRLSIDNLHAELISLLDRELSLTQAQRSNIEPIIAQACEEYREETLRAVTRVNDHPPDA